MTKNKNHKKTDYQSKAAAGQNGNWRNAVQKTKEAPSKGESPPTNGTSASSSNGIQQQQQQQRNGGVKPIPWERELLGTFLLEISDTQVISARNGWYVDKTQLRRVFEHYLLKWPEMRAMVSATGPWNIGSLLHRTNFLMNTPRGDSNYRIKSFALMEYRKEKFNEIDEKRRKQRDVVVTNAAGTASDANGTIVEEYVLDDKAEAVELKYQKTQKQLPDKKFELGSLGCYICQCNFDSIEKYEEHIEFHGDESDFQSLQEMEKFRAPMLKLSYQSCVKSHYFGFTLETELSDITIEKFIIVQSRQFYYVYHSRLPMAMPESGQLRFFVDSHVFMILREQPIVIGYSRDLDSGKQHFVEQHHFMRTEALPKATFAVNPYRLSNKETFRAKGRLETASPPPAVLKALKQNDVEEQLISYNKHYRNYHENGRQLSYENMRGTLETLLQIEDVEGLQHYVALKQTNRELHQFGKELSVKMSTNQRSISAEDVLSPYDDVLIINERSTSGGNISRVLDNNNLVLEMALMDLDAVLDWARALNVQFGELGKHELRVYFARVLSVSAQRVNITCERQLPDNTRYTLVFRPMRSVIRYQYRALQMLGTINRNDVRRLLYPDIVAADAFNKNAGYSLKLGNENIARNPEQLQAVQQIATCELFPAPYIVFGPPGTGKTATICEAIFQLFVRRSNTRILVLAGSNTACDEVALRLLRSISNSPYASQRSLTRIFSASCDRRIDNIDDLLLEYSNMYTLHFYPKVEAVHEYRIVVCTLSLAGKLSTGGFGSAGVFTHVFVDEAAASTEAEVLMGITCTMAPRTNLILSGDHKQLSAVLQSQRASDWGLSLSLFERLLQRDCYKVDENGGYNVAVQTRLLRNFRSHPQIVSLYNELYYSGTLMAEAPLENVSMAKNWFHTHNADFPILFHSVFGTVINTKHSVSLCNNKEIDAVMDYVKDLMYFGINGEKITQTDIGIISPYKNQYQRIQEQLNMRNWPLIDCGSVEMFQGKEKQIIIVSFVRSFTTKLGFLNNNRRLNVLLSRPMSLLILIGNPKTLSQNQDFRHIIDKCRAHKTLVGSPYYCDDDNSIAMANMKLQHGKNPPSKVNEIVAAEDAVLGQSFKRKTTVTKIPITPAKLLYARDELLKLKTTTTATKKTELDILFDELPKVPKNELYDKSEASEVELQRYYDQINRTNATKNGTSTLKSNMEKTKKTDRVAAGATINVYPNLQAQSGDARSRTVPAAIQFPFIPYTIIHTHVEETYAPTAPALGFDSRYNCRLPNYRFDSTRSTGITSSGLGYSTGSSGTRPMPSYSGDQPPRVQKKKKDCVIL